MMDTATLRWKNKKLDDIHDMKVEITEESHSKAKEIEAIGLLSSDVLKPPMEQPANGSKKILFLDGVRGIAAISVILQHGYYMGGLLVGACAVDVFFILSSLLLTMLFEKKCRKLIAQNATMRTWFYTLLDYFSKRFFRVYPLFVVVAIIVWALPNEAKTKYYWVANPEEYDLFKVLIFEKPYRYHAFWTLPIEIGYYFLIPAFVFIIIALGRYWWALCAPLYIWVLYIGMFRYRGHHESLAKHLTTFVAGSLAAIVYLKIEYAIKKYNFKFQLWHTLVLRSIEHIAFALLLSVWFRGLFFNWVFENPVSQTPGVPFVSVLASIVIVAEMIKPSELSKIFEWNVLRFAGKISFSMYLLHSFVIFNDSISNQPYFDKLFSVFGLTFLLSTISYYSVEYPVQLVSNRVSAYLIEKSKDQSTTSQGIWRNNGALAIGVAVFIMFVIITDGWHDIIRM